MQPISLLKQTLLLMLLSWKLAIGLGFILGGAVYYFLTHYINKKIPQRIIDDGRLIGVVEQINKLRKQITRINNSHLNSLKQNSKLTTEENPEFISSTNVEQTVQQIRVKLFLFSKEISS